MSTRLLDRLSQLQTRQPLLLFLLLGCGIFLLDRGPARDAHADLPKIQLSPEQTAALREKYPQQSIADLDAGELRAALGDWLDREALYHEARRLGLDAADPIIYRRLVQKMRILLEDLHPLPEPTDAELQQWLDEHGDQYGEPPRYRFEQVFLSRGKHGADIGPLATTLLQRIRAGEADYRDLGDPFVTGPSVGPITPRELRKHFGKQFADALQATQPGAWQGPLVSGYGLHLVRITDFQPFRTYSLGHARERVRKDYLLAQRRKRNRELIDQLIARYQAVPTAQEEPGE